MFNRIFIVGYGRLGSALAKQISYCGIQLSGVVIRNNHQVMPFPVFSDTQTLRENLITGDAVFLTVPDSQIYDLAAAFDLPGITVLHCSGATEIFKSKHCFSGVFYPLMTFNNSNKGYNWSEIPVFLESGDEYTMNHLKSFCAQIAILNIHRIDSHQRQKIHVSAVIANNMIQALYAASAKYLHENDLPSEVLLPILHKMSDSWGAADPIQSLTGPMVRGDMKTISLHEHLLETYPELLAVYRDMNKLIVQLLEKSGN